MWIFDGLECFFLILSYFPTKFRAAVYSSLIIPSFVSFLWLFWINLLSTACANCGTPWDISPWILLTRFSCVSNAHRKLSQPIFNLVKTSWWIYGHQARIFSAVRLRTPSQGSFQNSYHFLCHRHRAPPSITSPNRCSSLFHRRATGVIFEFTHI